MESQGQGTVVPLAMDVAIAKLKLPIPFCPCAIYAEPPWRLILQENLPRFLLDWDQNSTETTTSETIQPN